jgi:hypothetical protein
MKFWPKKLDVVYIALGLIGGIWLQHRWPLGTWHTRLEAWRRVPDEIQVADLVRLPTARRLVIVVAGQSNAANYGESRRAAGAPVLAFSEGKFFAAVDPLPGGDGDGGSVWSRLGARLAMTGAYNSIVFAVVARGGARASDWAPGGGQHLRLMTTLYALKTAGLAADFILWQQGETEARDEAGTGIDYVRALDAVRTSCREVFPQAVFLAATATRNGDTATNEQVRLAQQAKSPVGPDLDTLGDGYRRDGVHFNDRGLNAAASLWLDALHAAGLPAMDGSKTP